MKTTLTISDESLTGKLLNQIILELEDEIITVGELIKVRVHKEIENYNQSISSYFNGLVQPTETEVVLNQTKSVKQKRTIDAEQQTYIALEAFQQNGFFILIDNQQAESLEQEILVAKDTQVSFVKLTPLVGG